MIVLIMALLLGAPQGAVFAGRTGVISGQVRLPGGAPVAGIRVAAMDAPDMGTQDSAVSVLAAQTQTDATGHYRLEDIPVGRYFVVAGNLDNLSYYPNSIALTSVTPAENIDFVLENTDDGSLEVSVHRVGSAIAVPGAVVRIQATASSFVRSVVANDQGVAVFSGLPYGDFLVSTPTVSMVDALAGGTAPGRDVAVTITINPDRPKWAVSLGLLLPGIVRGTVRNAAGMPAGDVEVSSLIDEYRSGQRVFVAESSTRTLNSGEYELLTSPGTHRIRVAVDHENPPASADSAAVVDISSYPTFYPSSVNPANARPVVVGNGETLNAIDIAIGPGFAVKGRIAADLAAQTVPSFVLEPRSGQSEVVPGVRYLPDDNGGAFELNGIPPGKWDMFAFTGTNSQQHQSGKVALEVLDHDIEGVTIASSTVDVHGRITGLGSESATVKLVPVDSISESFADIEPGLEFPSPSGEFVFSNVVPLRYRIEIYGLPSGWYVADVRNGAESIFNDNVITTDRTAPPSLEVAVARGGGSIEGIVEHLPSNGRLSDARVVLVPDEPRRQNVQLFRTVPIGANGKFVIGSDLTPGSYTIFATTQLPDGHAEWNAEFLAKYADAAVPLTVLPNRTIQTTVEMTRAR